MTKKKMLKFETKERKNSIFYKDSAFCNMKLAKRDFCVEAVFYGEWSGWYWASRRGADEGGDKVVYSARMNTCFQREYIRALSTYEFTHSQSPPWRTVNGGRRYLCIISA